MQQDVNKLIDVINAEWSQQVSNANCKIAILTEQNARLQEENEQLKSEKGSEEHIA
ncbi:hypothetical protein Pryu01_02779 [Paraliobacillus ryukyuensis]|uniref:Uncharacterized protein n=1 Tax=Paraliobacillus ryukyuensis TaxID=200904 RepID=A0A366DSZ4_9BACI|nr:hypothetical protein [Paraliobacillus ryukyuensis]RBO93211.1 hypothetical protein DES48_11212 [Paraliobacillus ryukyuensis]